jgi:hypothetical protein
VKFKNEDGRLANRDAVVELVDFVKDLAAKSDVLISVEMDGLIGMCSSQLNKGPEIRRQLNDKVFSGKFCIAAEDSVTDTAMYLEAPVLCWSWGDARD